MSKNMLAAVAHQFNKPLIIEEILIPEINPDQILIKLKASGICHTDIHAVSGDWPVKPTLPFIPGHEGVGVIAAVGSNVKFLKEGDRVGIPWLHTTCAHCEFCLSGWETLCLSQKNTGYSVNGCYAEYVVADPNYVAILPERLDFFGAASLLCAGVTAYKGIKETNTKAGDWIVIIGIGGLGHMAIQYAKAMGLNVVAVDIHDQQLELANKLKADMVINSATEDPIIKIHKEIKGAHGILATATSAKALSQATHMLRRHGTLVLVGLPPGNIEISIFDLVLNRKTIRGSIVGTRMDLIECLNFAVEGKIAVQYITDKLKNINQIFETMKVGRIQGRIIMEI